ncbi:hypothetical protein D9611_007335 [Ephemerocybe angulata]|uniref:Ribonuclease H1 N-terminal domain-containing protein n=1 Tax=Ephemerocybe angulata TaxID=980116 RepID=A0A8H5CG82_9AGAR|nr:hypothetical protein D9611_007335 [Tulosesus angulatus]
MVNQSNVSQEGITTIGRVAVSPSLLRLLGSLIRAIDDRHLILDAFVPAENVEHDLGTCTRCMGTGIVRVPIGVSDDEDDDFDQVFPPPSANDAAPSPVASTATTHPAPSTSVPVAPPATSIPAAAVVAGTTPAAAAVAGTTPSATVAGSTPVASTVPVASNAPAPAMPLEVPAPTAPIPGLHFLGPNVPAPAPEVAVYTANDCKRYYTVTRGIRVGVFGDWMNTSPFVTGVPAASYTRHRTLLAAYEAYVKAFGRGFVTHA